MSTQQFFATGWSQTLDLEISVDANDFSSLTISATTAGQKPMFASLSKSLILFTHCRILKFKAKLFNNQTVQRLSDLTL